MDSVQADDFQDPAFLQSQDGEYWFNFCMHQVKSLEVSMIERFREVEETVSAQLNDVTAHAKQAEAYCGEHIVALADLRKDLGVQRAQVSLLHQDAISVKEMDSEVRMCMHQVKNLEGTINDKVKEIDHLASTRMLEVTSLLEQTQAMFNGTRIKEAEQANNNRCNGATDLLQQAQIEHREPADPQVPQLQFVEAVPGVPRLHADEKVVEAIVIELRSWMDEAIARESRSWMDEVENMLQQARGEREDRAGALAAIDGLKETQVSISDCMNEARDLMQQTQAGLDRIGEVEYSLTSGLSEVSTLLRHVMRKPEDQAGQAPAPCAQAAHSAVARPSTAWCNNGGAASPQPSECGGEGTPAGAPRHAEGPVLNHDRPLAQALARRPCATPPEGLVARQAAPADQHADADPFTAALKSTMANLVTAVNHRLLGATPRQAQEAPPQPPRPQAPGQGGGACAAPQHPWEHARDPVEGPRSCSTPGGSLDVDAHAASGSKSNSGSPLGTGAAAAEQRAGGVRADESSPARTSSPRTSPAREPVVQVEVRVTGEQHHTVGRSSVAGSRTSEAAMACSPGRPARPEHLVQRGSPCQQRMMGPPASARRIDPVTFATAAGASPPPMSPQRPSVVECQGMAVGTPPHCMPVRSSSAPCGKVPKASSARSSLRTALEGCGTAELVPSKSLHQVERMRSVGQPPNSLTLTPKVHTVPVFRQDDVFRPHGTPVAPMRLSMSSGGGLHRRLDVQQQQQPFPAVRRYGIRQGWG